MKIKTSYTEIECNAEELRQSTSLSDAFYGAIRRAFNGPVVQGINDSEGEDEDEETGNA